MSARIDCWLPKGSFLRNVTILTGGTVFAQALMVAALPVLTRLYSPEDFSLLAVHVAILGIVTVVSCLRYNIAIPLPEHDSDAMALLAVALLAASGVSLLCALPVILAPEATARLIGQPGLQPYLWMIPVGVFIASIYNALQYWATRKKRFGDVAKTRMTQSFGGVGTQLGFGAVGVIPFGLLFGSTIANGLGVFRLSRSLWLSEGSILSNLSLIRMSKNAREYRRFPIYSVPETFFNSAGLNLPIIIIAATIIGPEAGFLFLAMRVMGLPTRLLASSVAQVYISEAPAKLRNGTLADFTNRTMWILFRTSAPLLILIGISSPAVFPVIFGAEWVRAGWIIAWLTPWFILQFVASPVSIVLHILEKHRLALFLQFLGAALRNGTVLIVAITYPEYSIEGFALSSALFYSAYIFTILLVCSRMVQRSEA